MTDQGFLFAEMQLRAGDIIDRKGKRVYSRELYKDMLFIQDHGGLFLVGQIKRLGEQIIYTIGGNENNYTRPEYIDYEGKGFESCLFYEVPENFQKIDGQL